MKTVPSTPHQPPISNDQGEVPMSVKEVRGFGTGSKEDELE